MPKFQFKSSSQRMQLKCAEKAYELKWVCAEREAVVHQFIGSASRLTSFWVRLSVGSQLHI